MDVAVHRRALAAIKPSRARTALAGLIALVFAMPAIVAPGAHAAVSTLGVATPTQVSPGQTFTAEVYQDADFPTLGAQASFIFDPNVLQVLSLQVGDPYAGANFFVGVDPQTPEDAIAEANITGTLVNLTTYELPGTGNVSPGRNTFVNVTMQARAGVSGSTRIQLDAGHSQGVDPITHATKDLITPIGLLADPPDPTGTLVPVNVVSAQLTVGSGGPASSGAPGASASVGASITPRPTTPPRVSTSPKTTSTSLGADQGPTASISVNPASIKVDPGASFSVALTVDSPVDLSGATLDVSFNKDVVSVDRIEPGSAWKPASQSYGSALSAANRSGQISALAILQKTGESALPAGSITLFNITFKGLKDGSSDLKVANAVFVDKAGNDVRVGKTVNSSATVGSGGGSSSLPMIGGALLLVAAIGGGGGFVWYRRHKRWSA